VVLKWSRELWLACSARRERIIAERACQKNSERVGGSAAAKLWMNEPSLLFIFLAISSCI